MVNFPKLQIKNLLYCYKIHSARWAKFLLGLVVDLLTTDYRCTGSFASCVVGDFHSLALFGLTGSYNSPLLKLQSDFTCQRVPYSHSILNTVSSMNEGGCSGIFHSEMTNSFVGLYFHFIPSSSVLSLTNQRFTVLIMTI